VQISFGLAGDDESRGVRHTALAAGWRGFISKYTKFFSTIKGDEVTARLTMLLIAVVAAMVVGCGGGDSEGSAADGEGDSAVTTVSASSLNKAEFVRKADSICRSGAFEAIEGEPPDGGPAPVQLPDRVETVMVPAFTQVADEVQQLGAPRGDEAEVEAFLAALHEDIDSLEQRSSAQKSLVKLQYEFEGSSELARSYGIYACAYLKRPRLPKTAQELREEEQQDR